jgi:integrase/recombinase XerD
MNAWPDTGFAAIERYVRQLRLRHPKTGRIYRSDLRAFQRFLTRRRRHVTEQILIGWIQQRSKELRPITLHDRTRKVSNFLDFLVRDGVLAANPLNTLRERCRTRSLPAIVRALTGPDPEQALEALRQPVRWASPLGPRMRDHVALMQSVGYRYVAQECRFLAFDRFLQGRPDLNEQPLQAMIKAWAHDTPTLEHAWQCQRVGRDLSRAWNRIDPTVPVLKRDRNLEAQLERQRRRPHIYSQADVCRALNVARQLSTPRSPLLPSTAYMMVVLAYCAGLRIGEIVRLTLGNVHLSDGILEIQNSKFFKSRRVPLDPTVLAALRDYLAARQTAGGPSHDTAPLFWHEQRGTGYTRGRAQELLIDILRRAGLKPARGRTGPRIHDLRHAFVVHRMLDWYRQGIDPEPRLPYLAAYLGHKSIHSTLVYITVTGELLQQAAERFRRHSALKLRTEGVLP